VTEGLGLVTVLATAPGSARAAPAAGAYVRVFAREGPAGEPWFYKVRGGGGPPPGRSRGLDWHRSPSCSLPSCHRARALLPREGARVRGERRPTHGALPANPPSPPGRLHRRARRLRLCHPDCVDRPQRAARGVCHFCVPRRARRRHRARGCAAAPLTRSSCGATARVSAPPARVVVVSALTTDTAVGPRPGGRARRARRKQPVGGAGVGRARADQPVQGHMRPGERGSTGRSLRSFGGGGGELEPGRCRVAGDGKQHASKQAAKSNPGLVGSASVSQGAAGRAAPCCAPPAGTPPQDGVRATAGGVRGRRARWAPHPHLGSGALRQSVRPVPARQRRGRRRQSDERAHGIPGRGAARAPLNAARLSVRAASQAAAAAQREQGGTRACRPMQLAAQRVGQCPRGA
jgi:hypothetical protein